jgi:hypothetical protein
MKKIILYQKGFIHDKIPEDLFKELINNLNINDIDSKPDHSNKLVGNLEIEKKVTDLIPSNFYDYLSKLSNVYCNNFVVNKLHPDESINSKKQFVFFDSWINYQKKHEFNPCHDHGGTLSYVIWIKIPYDVKKELSMPNNINSNRPCNSVFSFVGDDFFYYIDVSKEMEGEIIMFDSLQKHVVYPFYTSDDFRISMSGNIQVQMSFNVD